MAPGTDWGAALTSANPWTMCRPASISEGDDGARPGHQVRLLQVQHEVLRPEEAGAGVPEVRRGPARDAVRQAFRLPRARRPSERGRARGGRGRRRGRSRGRGRRRGGRIGRGLSLLETLREQASGCAFDARALQPLRYLVLAVDEDGLERAALHALLAAGAALLVDEGDGALVLLQEPLHVAVLIEDGVDGAHGPAGAAIDAQVRQDDVQRLSLAADRVGRAPLHAGRAPDARLDDPVRHPLTSSMPARPAAGNLRRSVAVRPPSEAGGRA